MDINAVLAEATTVAEPVEASTEAVEAVEAPQEPTETVESEDIGKKADSELTPEQLAKREANRRSHENSRAARMKRELRELRETVQRISAQPQVKQPANNAPVPPDENDFSNWDDLRAAERKYNADLVKWEVEQKLSERDTASTEQTQQAAVQDYTAKRIEGHVAQEAQFAKQVPDYEQTVYGEYSDFMQNLPLPVAQALIEADGPQLALYALAKEGVLEDLQDMSPYRVSMEIAKAEIRGAAYLNQNKATNAPTPVRAARGTGEVSRALHNKSVEELMKQFNNR